MKADKIRQFIALAGQSAAASFEVGDAEQRKLGAQLLLSEVLEYIIYGLGVHPEVRGISITHPEEINYVLNGNEPNRLDMLDGLADVAYTMYWNSVAFGVPLEEAFELVCDNNLQKFVSLKNWTRGEIELSSEDWSCGRNVAWPPEVVSVKVVNVDGNFFAVGRDGRGKVRKPSTYDPVDLSDLLNR